MGLTGKILLFIATLVVLLVGGTLVFTTIQANQLARSTIDSGLQETRDVWHTIQDDRFKKLRLGVRVLANDPYFKAAIAERDQNTALDSLGERGQDLAADFMMATDPAGKLIARTDRPSDTGDDLSKDPIVKKALEGRRRGRPLASRRPALHRGRGADADGSRARRRDGGRLPAERSGRGADAQDHPQRHGVPGAAGRTAREGRGLVARPARAGARRVARDAADGPGGRPLRARPRGRALHRRAHAADERDRRDDRRGARAAEPLGGDGPLPPLPQRPGRRLARRDGARAAGRVGRGVADHGAGAQAGRARRADPRRLLLGSGRGPGPRRDRRAGARLQRARGGPAREGPDDQLPPRRHDGDAQDRRRDDTRQRHQPG